MIEIKKCKCGGEAILDNLCIGKSYFVVCQNCGKEGQWSMYEQEAVDFWNKEVEDD